MLIYCINSVSVFGDDFVFLLLNQMKWCDLMDLKTVWRAFRRSKVSISRSRRVNLLAQPIGFNDF